MAWRLGLFISRGASVGVRRGCPHRLSCSIASTGVVPGKYSCYINGADVEPPGGNASVCAKLTDANLAGRLGGTKDLKVAVVTVRVVPSP